MKVLTAVINLYCDGLPGRNTLAYSSRVLMSLKNILSTLTRGGGCQNQRKLLNGSHDIQHNDTQ